MIKVEDNNTTDHIMPSDSKLLPFRSNVPHLANYCLTPVILISRNGAKNRGGGFIIAGHNYGQGQPRTRGFGSPAPSKGVLAKSFARIHMLILVIMVFCLWYLTMKTTMTRSTSWMNLSLPMP